METTLKQLGPLQWELSFGLDTGKVEAAVERQLVELKPKARVPGFRRGKAPIAVVARHYQDKLRKQEWERLAQSELRRELAGRGLRTVAAPRLEPMEDEAGVRATFEVFPELPALRVDDLSVRRPRVEIGDSDVDHMVDRIREELKSWQPVRRPSEPGDRVELEIIASATGWRWPRKGREKLVQTVDGDGFLAFLGRRLEGRRAGDLVEEEVVPPAEHDLARGPGEVVSLRVKVCRVLSASLPDFGRAQIRALGVEDGTMSTLRRELAASMKAELAEALEGEDAIAVESALLEAHPGLELPETLLSAQIDRLRRQDRTSEPRPDQALETEARRLLGTALLLADAARQLGLKPDPTELWEETERIAAESGDHQEELDRIWADGERVQDIEERLLRTKVVAAVLERARVEDVPMSFAELTRKRRERLAERGA